jgi:GNAT superfamily N-acetyltransferase
LYCDRRHLPGTQLTLDDIRLRPETAEDETFLRRLNIAVRWNEFAALPLPPEQKIALLQQQYEARHKSYRAEYPDADFYIIERNGTAIGRFYLHRGKREHYMVDLAILPDHSGQGVGGAVFDMAMTEAKRAGVDVTLRVDHLNPAKRLYLRKGFIDVEDLGLDMLMRWTPPRT